MKTFNIDSTIEHCDKLCEQLSLLETFSNYLKLYSNHIDVSKKVVESIVPMKKHTPEKQSLSLFGIGPTNNYKAKLCFENQVVHYLPLNKQHLQLSIMTNMSIAVNTIRWQPGYKKQANSDYLFGLVNYDNYYSVYMFTADEVKKQSHGNNEHSSEMTYYTVRDSNYLERHYVGIMKKLNFHKNVILVRNICRKIRNR